MNLSQLSDDELKQAKRDTERACIVSFTDAPTLRKLIAAFEDDLREPGNGPGSGRIKRAEAGE